MKWFWGCTILILATVLFIGMEVSQISKNTIAARRTTPPPREPVNLHEVKWPVQVAKEVFNRAPEFPEATRVFFIGAAQEVPLSKLVNLAIFRDFRPGFTIDEAVARYGKPSKVQENKAGRAAIYEFPNVRIEIEHNVYDSGFFAEYHRKSVYAYLKSDNGCTRAETILDASINLLIPTNSSVEVHVAEAQESGQHVFVLVNDGCVRAMNWLLVGA